MRNGKKLWSLLLTVIMVVSLFGGISLVGAAEDSVTVTPDATVGGETVTMTATGLDDQVAVFDMSAFGMSGINYGFWFDHSGTFSFDKDVTLSYQGAQTAEVKAGEVISIADGVNGGSWSEYALSLDSGDFLTILDKDNPGNFGGLPTDSIDAFPGKTGTAAAAPAPAEEAKTEQAKTEETAAAAEGGFTKATSLEAGKEYLIVTEYEGKYYALTCSGSSLGVAEVTVADGAVAAAEDSQLWLPDGADHMQSKGSPDQYICATSGGLMAWGSSGLRTFVYDAASETVALHGSKYYLSFDGSQFGEADDASGAAKILLFTGSGAAAPEETKPAEKVEYPAPETVRRSAVKNADGSITLAFTSDTHYNGVNMNLQTWLEAADLGYIDAFGFCGDLGSAGASTPAMFWGLVGDVMDYMDSLITEGKLGNAIYTHGNHEWASYAGGNYGKEYANYPAAQQLMQVGEGLVTEDYIIYCFGADKTATDYLFDYDPEDIATLAAYLETAPTDIPIFILTHYPLHQWFGARLGTDRYMAHAGELIDVLNTHCNVVLLWGHNHNDFDDNYYRPVFPGQEVVIDPQGTTKTLNFTCLPAGCTSDTEYSGPDAGSATVMNKGLVVTINADGSLEYNYYTMDGKQMHVVSPWLVRFRTGVDNYEPFADQYVEDGKTPDAVEAPEFEGYSFQGWYVWNDNAEVPFDFTAPVTKNTLVTAKYARVLKPAARPDAADCVSVTPDTAAGGESLTMTAAGVGDQITVFDLASIGYGTGIMYGFWFDADGVVSFNQDVTLYYQGNATDFTLKAGEFYSVKGFSEHYVPLDNGDSVLLLENDNPGNYASLPGDQPFSAFPGAVDAAEIKCEVSTQAITVDGVVKEIDHYNIGNYNYFKLRDLACLLNGTANAFNVEYDHPARTVSITTGAAYTPIEGDLVIGEDMSATAALSSQSVKVDGEAASIKAYNIGGYNFFKLADLAPVLGFELTYDEGERTAQIATK